MLCAASSNVLTSRRMSLSLDTSVSSRDSSLGGSPVSAEASPYDFSTTEHSWSLEPK